jgi:uncharacterized protein (TIGR03435 family)
MVEKRLSLMLRAAAVLLLAALGSQSQNAPPLRFEVATIKPNKDGAGRGGLDVQPGGILKMQGVTLKGLIAFAYDIPEPRISGGPKWIDSDSYDVLARPEHPAAEDMPQSTIAPGTTAWDRVRLRLQTLLAERFGVVVHKTSHEAQGFRLVQAKGGAKLTATNDQGNPRTMRGFGRIDGERGTMKMLAGLLSNWFGRPVLDETGLAGAYNYKLEFQQEEGEGARPGTGLTVTSVGPALQEQLGLRLEPAHVPIESIVVDKANHPSAN